MPPSRLRTCGVSLWASVPTAARRAWGSLLSSAASASPVSISSFTAAFVSTPTRPRNSVMLAASSERIISSTAASRTTGSGFDRSKRATAVLSSFLNWLLVPISVSSSRGIEPASFSDSGSTSSKDVRLSSVDLTMKIF